MKKIDEMTAFEQQQLALLERQVAAMEANTRALADLRHVPQADGGKLAGQIEQWEKDAVSPAPTHRRYPVAIRCHDQERGWDYQVGAVLVETQAFERAGVFYAPKVTELLVNGLERDGSDGFAAIRKLLTDELLLVHGPAIEEHRRHHNAAGEQQVMQIVNGVRGVQGLLWTRCHVHLIRRVIGKSLPDLVKAGTVILDEHDPAGVAAE